jgi:cytidine deaminase
MIKKEFSLSIRAHIVEFATLTSQEQMLIHRAIAVRRNAQAPYSKFAVGVALLSEHGTIHTGCNVERCSYSQTTHAEQNAIDNMIAECGSVKIAMIAVVGATINTELNPSQNATGQTISSPEEATLACGHCRQIIWENCFQDPQVKLLSLTPHGDVLVTTIGDLLPMSFGPANLGIDYRKNNAKATCAHKQKAL